MQVLRLCWEAGLVKLGHVALDGTKLAANASKHKAMSYRRMARAEREDAADDAAHGPERWGDELPEWGKQQRLARIRPAKAALEAEAKADASPPDAARSRPKPSNSNCSEVHSVGIGPRTRIR